MLTLEIWPRYIRQSTQRFHLDEEDHLCPTSYPLSISWISASKAVAVNMTKTSKQNPSIKIQAKPCLIRVNLQRVAIENLCITYSKLTKFQSFQETNCCSTQKFCRSKSTVSPQLATLQNSVLQFLNKQKNQNRFWLKKGRKRHGRHASSLWTEPGRKNSLARY